jgi:hypothetical protein
MVSRLGPRERAWWPFAPVVVLAVGALVHWPALRTFFAQDDVTFLARAMGLEPTPWSLARPLSTGVTWRAAHALFGLNPLPYHVLNLVLHLTSAALVAAIGGRLGLRRGGSLAAGLLFAATPIAFTPTHWASCIQEILATIFSLVAFWLWLVGRERGSIPLLWAGALTGVAAVLSKENAVLLPVVLVAANLGTTQTRPWRVIVPQATLMLVFVVAYLATLRPGDSLGGAAYSRDFSPGFLIANFATYLRWCVSPHVPVPDLHAIASPAALPVGAAVVLVLAALIWMTRRKPPHPETVGIVWFLAMLAPVLPLAHHTYLYYLYLPWAGICWACAGAAERLAGRWSALRAPLLALLALVVALDFWSVRARERETLGPFAADKVVRESRLLERCLSQLRSLQLPPGTRIAFVNPGGRDHVHFGTDSVASSQAILPLEGALRDGEALRVFTPHIRYAGFAFSLPREWEDAQVLLFNDQADLMDLGIGGQALARLGTFCLEVHNDETADSLFRRSRARGDTLPDATYGLVLTADAFGHPAESDRYAREFLQRWPNDPRSAYLDSVLRASSQPTDAPR